MTGEIVASTILLALGIMALGPPKNAGDYIVGTLFILIGSIILLHAFGIDLLGCLK